MVFCSSFLFAQVNKGYEPIYEKQGELVAVTLFYENGSIKEQGFYKDKKLHGEWIKYNREGVKITRAQYNCGMKTGNWMFLNKGILTEVTYKNNRITEVKDLNEDVILD